MAGRAKSLENTTKAAVFVFGTWRFSSAEMGRERQGGQLAQ